MTNTALGAASGLQCYCILVRVFTSCSTRLASTPVVVRHLHKPRKLGYGHADTLEKVKVERLRLSLDKTPASSASSGF